jgi:hypothetical protein
VLRFAALFFAIALTLGAACPASAVLLFLYDFSGPAPNNALAANQTNPQPANATFSDFTRQPPLQATDSNVFGTKNWQPGTTIDLTQYVGYSVAGAGGGVLNLTHVTFDVTNPVDGPAHLQIALYLNGSATPYEWSPDYSIQNVATTLTFDFTDLTTADNVTDATFKLYAWDAASNGAHLDLDNVATFGAIVVVPEISNVWIGIMGIIVAATFGGRAVVWNRVWKRRRFPDTGPLGTNFR